MLSVSYSFVIQWLIGNVPQDEDSVLELVSSESTANDLLEEVKKFSSKICDNMEENKMEAELVVWHAVTERTFRPKLKK